MKLINLFNTVFYRKNTKELFILNSIKNNKYSWKYIFNKADNKEWVWDCKDIIQEFCDGNYLNFEKKK